VRGRFPFATLMAVVAGVLLIVAGEWMWALVFFAIAAVFGAVTLRSAR
jgi:membrane protein implicated in regulation of membrane protease activity